MPQWQLGSNAIRLPLLIQKTIGVLNGHSSSEKIYKANYTYNRSIPNNTMNMLSYNKHLRYYHDKTANLAILGLIITVKLSAQQRDDKHSGTIGSDPAN